MEILYSGNVVFNIDIENQIKFAHLIQEKKQKNIPLEGIEHAFIEAQREEDMQENEKTFRR